MMLNAANDRVAELAGEIEAYKATGGDLGGSTRTRVVRRQPEGGMLSSINGKSRSVSGPAGRWGR
jgi:hypothetical protein